MQPLKKNAGFTLVEMMVVLTIIALILGVVIGGRSMMRSAQIQRTISDVEEYKQAVLLFKEKYSFFPGDFPDATSIWGSETTCPYPNPYTSTPHTVTCNGDGNGQISFLTATAYAAGGEEAVRAWQHLANAKMIKGSYTGTAPSGQAGMGVPIPTPGINAPAARLSGATFSILYMVMPDGSGVNYPAEYRHIIQVGGTLSNVALPTSMTPVFSSLEAFGVDSKIDDGRPAYGKVMTNNTQIESNCTTSDTPTAAEYKIAYTAGYGCSLIFITGF